MTGKKMSGRKLMTWVAIGIATAVLGGTAYLPQAVAQDAYQTGGPVFHFFTRDGDLDRDGAPDRDDHAHRDRDPHLAQALRQLQAAEENLERADPDSQGWRVKAMQEAAEAINDTRHALNHDH